MSKKTITTVTDETKPKSKTSGKRNRAAGHQWETESAQKFRIAFPAVATSRACNRTRDAQKVDLAHPDEIKYGRFPYNVQCKAYTGSIPYLNLIREMPKDSDAINVIFHRYMVKKKTRFFNAGEFAILNVVDFHKMARIGKAYELLNAHFEYLPKEVQESLLGQLEALEV